MEYVDFNECGKDFSDLSTEFVKLKSQHATYLKQLEDLLSAQAKCLSSIGHQRYRLSQLIPGLKRISRFGDPDSRTKAAELLKQVDERKHNLDELNESLPRKNGLYLSIILGQVNVSILNKREKFAYKEEYERFKFVVTAISLVWAILLYFYDSKALDAGFSFLLVWYYCTLTIREQILSINGSRIKGWWLAHHFISTVCSGIYLIWPDGESYRMFREQFILFSAYLSFVQFVQFYYQMGSLYRLRALGEQPEMAVTVEGFHSWMWRGLTALLPFLFIAYFFQLYNAYVLYWLSQQAFCSEWHVFVLAIIFLILFCGNMLTVGAAVIKKLSEKRNFFWRHDLLAKYRFSGAFGHSGGTSTPGTSNSEKDE